MFSWGQRAVTTWRRETGERMNFLQLIRSDYRRYRAAGARPVGVIFFTQGFWASTVYRCQHAANRRFCRWPGIGAMVRVFGAVTQKAVEVLTGISLPSGTEVGEGLYIGHFGNIIVSPAACLGRNCNLSQGVTLGAAGRGDRHGAPRLGDRVYVGAGAIILGAVEIGDDAAIGAGAVVTKSVPARGVVVGNPARLISRRGSFDFVVYPDMECDLARQAALACVEDEVENASDSAAGRQWRFPSGAGGV